VWRLTADEVETATPKFPTSPRKRLRFPPTPGRGNSRSDKIGTGEEPADDQPDSQSNKSLTWEDYVKKEEQRTGEVRNLGTGYLKEELRSGKRE